MRGVPAWVFLRIFSQRCRPDPNGLVDGGIANGVQTKLPAVLGHLIGQGLQISIAGKEGLAVEAGLPVVVLGGPGGRTGEAAIDGGRLTNGTGLSRSSPYPVLCG